MTPKHRPVVLLARRPDLRPPDATPEDATWMMIGSLLELGGPKAVTEPLAQFPPGQRRELVRTVLAARCCPGYLRDLMDADAAAETNAEVIARIAREREPVDLTMDDILAARDEGRR